MSTRERILTIRLLEKVKEHPAYAGALGIEAQMLHTQPGTDSDLPEKCRKEVSKNW